MVTSFSFPLKYLTPFLLLLSFLAPSILLPEAITKSKVPAAQRNYEPLKLRAAFAMNKSRCRADQGCSFGAGDREAATLNSRCPGLGVHPIQGLRANSFQAIQPTEMFGLALNVLDRSQNYLPVLKKKIRDFIF